MVQAVKEWERFSLIGQKKFQNVQIRVEDDEKEVIRGKADL